MVPRNDLPTLLSTLYAAPLEPAMWQKFLDQVCASANISCGYLVTSNPREGNTLLAGGGLNYDPEVLHLYNTEYGADDPYRAPMIAKPTVGLIAGEQLVDRPTLVRSELYNGVLSRFDLEYMNMLSCNCTDEHVDALSLWRSANHGPLDRDSAGLLEMLIPHVRTALRLRTRVATFDASNLFAEVSLDAMLIAALLVTGTGCVRSMNGLAAQCLTAGDGITTLGGAITPTDARCAAQFKRLLAGAARLGVGGKSTLPRGGAMKLPRRRTAEPLSVTVVPVPDQNRIAHGDTLAVVFIADPSLPPRPRAEWMRQLYGLSPAEARIADLLMQGFDVREAADELKGSVETTRSHVKRILAKTGTHRQAELMKLMLSLPGSVPCTPER